MIESLLLSCVLIQPVTSGAVEQRFDLVELNHYYDESGREVFSQVVFWQWSGTAYRGGAWRLWKSDAQTPWRSKVGYRAVWVDGELLRDVRATSYLESWTQHDPEFNDREYLPQEQRIGLRQP